MSFLLLAVMASVSIGVLVGHYRRSNRDIEVAIATNYAVATTAGWAVLAADGFPSIGTSALALGIVGGLLWPSSFHLYAVAIGRFGVGRAGAWSRLSLAVPVVFGLGLLGEPVTVSAVVGLGAIGLAFWALFPDDTPTVSPVGGTDLKVSNGAIVVTLVLVFGLVDVWVKVFDDIGRRQDEFAFLVVLFSSSAVVAWGALAARAKGGRRQGRPVAMSDVVAGAVLGVPNFATSWFMLQALMTDTFTDRSAVAFTLSSALTLVALAAVGRVLWRESLTARVATGIGLAVAAIGVLNLGI